MFNQGAQKKKVTASCLRNRGQVVVLRNGDTVRFVERPRHLVVVCGGLQHRGKGSAVLALEPSSVLPVSRSRDANDTGKFVMLPPGRTSIAALLYVCRPTYRPVPRRRLDGGFKGPKARSTRECFFSCLC